MAKLRVTAVTHIVKVQLLVGRILVTTRSGKERSFPYERLTARQETRLRSMAEPLPRREAKPSRSRSASKSRKNHNYAAEVTQRTTTDAILVNINGNFAGVLEVL